MYETKSAKGKVNGTRSGGTLAQASESFVSDVTQDKLSFPTKSRDNTCEVSSTFIRGSWMEASYIGTPRHLGMY